MSVPDCAEAPPTSIGHRFVQVVQAAQVVFGESRFSQDPTDGLLQPFQRPLEALFTACASGDIETDRLPMPLDSQHFIAGKELRGMVAEFANTYPSHSDLHQ